MRNLRVTLVQADLAWHNAEKNLARFDELLRSVESGSADLIVLPEMFTTGFTMEPHGLAEEMSGRTVARMLQWARERGADIAGGVIIGEDGKYYNRLVWARPGGDVLTYDKRHLFRMAGEEKVYTAGDKNITVELKGWRIRPFICYDLRFPMWTRNSGKEYDVAVFTANWPAKRSYHWKALLRARAIENQCYVIGLNRIGTDGKGISYTGDSTVIDYAGNILFEKGPEECLHTVELQYEGLIHYRESFPAWMDADPFTPA